MMKILSVVGTRPEAIKMAPVIDAIKKENNLDIKICSTSQHKIMLDQVFNLFGIKSDFDLNIMTPNQSLNQISSKIIKGLDKVFSSYKPDLVLVHGDTSTTFSAALSAFHNKIKVGHVEAGLRTHNLHSPWPEEANRCLTSLLTDYHFAPTKQAKLNLLNEGIKKSKVIITGNTVIDALLKTVKLINCNSKIRDQLKNKFNFLDEAKSLLLVTGHRRENFGIGLENICKSLLEISSSNKNIQIVYPVHLNPNVKKPVQKLLNKKDNIYLIEPQDYLSFCYLMDKSWLILSDSGGIQEEAISLKKPVLVMREFTEREEALKLGAVRLVGSSKKIIVSSVMELFDDKKKYRKMILKSNPYGNGKASKLISSFLKKSFHNG